MKRQRFANIGRSVLCLALLPCLMRAESPAAPDAKQLASRIDQLLTAAWSGKEIQPAPQTDDAEFIRRVYLDLAGRIPSIIEVRDFLDDPRPDKRSIWVERLLESPAYVQHFANIWRALLLSQANQQAQAQLPNFEAWLRQRLKENAGYDQLVRELLTTPPQTQNSLSPSAFYVNNELKAENLAGSTSRLFLGVKLECAQCHTHPFAPWTRTQFWEYATFFAEVEVPPRGPAGDRRELKIPGTDKVVRAKFLDGKDPVWKPDASSRAMLAEWLTAADNPYFARTVVNQMWAYFFGIGLIDPVVDAGDQNPPSHPELLDELAGQFIAHRFDLKFLIRTLVATAAYQRTSAATPPSQNDPRLFARMAVRALTPEQLFDSLAEVCEYREPMSANRRPFEGGVPSPRQEFLAKFGQTDRRTEAQTTILQALFLMNGKFMVDATSLEGNRTLATIAQAMSTDTNRRLETLYLVVLSRKPRPEEAARLLQYVQSGGPSADPKKALADILWALVNSAEFMLNH